MRASYRAAAVIAVVAVSGCGSRGLQAPVARTSPSAVQQLSPTSSPVPLPSSPPASPSCPDLQALGVERALLTSYDRNLSVVLCEAQDRAHPRLLRPLAGASPLTFLSAEKIGYVSATGSSDTPRGDITSTGRTLDLVTGQSTDVVSTRGLVLDFEWSHDLSMVAYLTDTSGVHNWWLKRGDAAPVALTAAIQFLGRGGDADDESLTAFSSDDKYVLVVDTAVARLQVFRTSDGVVVYRAPSGGAGGRRTMGVWARRSPKMYFRNDSGVYSWDPVGGISSYLPGLRWYDPAFTADDRYLAYTVAAVGAQPHVEIRDVSTGSLISSSPWRAYSIFLSATTLLLDEEAPCNSCEGGTFNWTGRTLVFHSDTRSETDLRITGWIFSAFWSQL